MFYGFFLCLLDDAIKKKNRYGCTAHVLHGTGHAV